MFFKNAQIAFQEAIASGLLSADTTSDRYAGNYMYMGSDIELDASGNAIASDAFKHRDTRKYVYCSTPVASERKAVQS